MHVFDEQPFEFTVKPQGERLFEVGKQFPPKEDIERLASYKRSKSLFDGKLHELQERAARLMQSPQQAEQLVSLRMAVNLLDIIVTKPADMLFGEPPVYEPGSKNATNRQREAIESIVKRNRLNQLGHELVTGTGYRGDGFLKVYFNYREDVSELPYIPESMKMEPIIETQDPSTVFVEMARGSRKKFKAINIAFVTWEYSLAKRTEIPYLNVERHIPGFIEYRKFRLSTLGPDGVNNQFGSAIETYRIEEEVPSGKPALVETGVDKPLIFHVPYKTVDTDWKGIGMGARLEDLILGIADRLAQIDYILWKHADPNIYGPDLDEKAVASGGKYIPVRKDEVAPAYMTWNSQLEAAFRELETLVGLVYQIAEIPQWVFGTSIGQAGGSGTSHTDSSSLQARFLPLLSKVKRIRSHVDEAFTNAIETAMKLDNIGNADVSSFEKYEPVEVSIRWKDGLPRNRKEEAEVMSVRTGGKATLDVKSAIKQLDEVSEAEAEEILSRIDEDEELLAPLPDPNEEVQISDEEVDAEIEKETETETESETEGDE